MPRPDPEQIIHALGGYLSFLKAFGDHDHDIKRFDEFIKRFREERFTKDLLREMVDFRDGVHSQVRMEIAVGKCLAGKDKTETTEEYFRALNPLGTAIYPPEPKPAEMDISGFSEISQIERKTTTYSGDPKGVRPVVEGSVKLIQQYSKIIGQGDFQKAYQLTGSGLRDWMTFNKFVSAHEKAARKYGGPALEFNISGFQFVLADAAARKKSKADEGWPKTTAKEDRRSKLTGFWIRDKTAQTGGWGSFHITDEAGEYRVAKFDFFTL